MTAPLTPAPTPRRALVSRAVLFAALGALAVGFVYVLGVVFVLVGDIRDSQKERVPLLENTNAAAEDAAAAALSAARAADAIEDCTTPEGTCYRDGEKRTQDAVGNIGILSAYATACASTEARTPSFPTLTAGQLADRIQACVDDLVARDTATGRKRR